MKIRIFITTVFLMFGFFNTQAQKKMIKKIKIVLVVNEKTNLVTNLIDHAKIKDLINTRGESQIHKKYPDSKFYIGLLKGNYKSNKSSILPSGGSTITVNTSKQLFGDKLGNFDKMGNFKKGDLVKLGGSEAEVISKLQVEMTLKVL